MKFYFVIYFLVALGSVSRAQSNAQSSEQVNYKEVSLTPERAPELIKKYTGIYRRDPTLDPGHCPTILNIKNSSNPVCVEIELKSLIDKRPNETLCFNFYSARTEVNAGWPEDLRAWSTRQRTTNLLETNNEVFQGELERESDQVVNEVNIIKNEFLMGPVARHLRSTQLSLSDPGLNKSLRAEFSIAFASDGFEVPTDAKPEFHCTYNSLSPKEVTQKTSEQAR